MPYLSISALKNYPATIEPEKAKLIFNNMLIACNELPHVKAGHIEPKTVYDFCDTVSKRFDMREATAIMLKNSIFTTEEVTALFRFENENYTNGLHASEVYSAKNLLSVDVSGFARLTKDGLEPDTVNRFIHRLIKHNISAQLGNDIDSLTMSKMATANKSGNQPWMASSPFLLTHRNGANVVINARINLPERTSNAEYQPSEADLIRLNYQAGVLQNIGKTEGTQLSLINYNESYELANAKYQMATAMKLRASDLPELANNIDMPMTHHTIPLDNALIRQIRQVGDHHYKNIFVNGVEPEFNKKVFATADPSIVQKRNDIAHDIISLSMIKSAADTLEHEARQAIKTIDDRFGLSGQEDGLSKMIVRADHKVTDYEALAGAVKAKGATDGQIMKRQIDTGEWAKAAKHGQTNPNDYVYFEGIDQKRVKEMAQIHGIDTKAFEHSETKHHITSQSRGPLAEIKNALKNDASSMLTDLVSDLKNSTALKQAAVFGFDERRLDNQEQAKPDQSVQDNVAQTHSTEAQQQVAQQSQVAKQANRKKSPSTGM